MAALFIVKGCRGWCSAWSLLRSQQGSSFAGQMAVFHMFCLIFHHASIRYESREHVQEGRNWKMQENKFQNESPKF